MYTKKNNVIVECNNKKCLNNNLVSGCNKKDIKINKKGFCSSERESK